MDTSDGFNWSGGASWEPNQSVPVLRSPRECACSSPPTVPSGVSVLGGGDPEPKTINSRLSADAKEFVPKSYQAMQPPATPEISARNTLTGRVPVHPQTSPVPLPQGSHHSHKKVSYQDRLNKYQTNGTDKSHQETNHTTNTQHNNKDFTSSTQHVVRRYNEYMQEIIVKPGRFDALARMLLDESISWFGDSEIAYAVVDAIVTQAIIERNFQYNGARLCSLLSTELDTSDVPVFKNHLFERIKIEYNKIVPGVEKHPSKAYGFVGFLAELYTQMGHADLGEYFLNIVDGLVSSLTVESIKRVCQLLKLTGRMLDKENKPKMEAAMQKLEKAGYKTNTTQLVGSVMLLRDQNWGEEAGHDPKAAMIDSSLSGLPCLQSEAVQYGPDGIALSKEESDFLHSSYNISDDNLEIEDADDFGDEYAPLDEDEMDEEMEKGFLEFLIESKQI